MGKEEKFFDLLKELASQTDHTGHLMYETMTGTMSPEDGWRAAGEIRKSYDGMYSRLLDKMYKAYKDPSDLDMAKGIICRLNHSLRTLNRLVCQAGLLQDTPPEQLSLMARLSAASVEEMKKILEYTADMNANYMKMEARGRRIYAYEERGMTCLSGALQRLYSEEGKAASLIYWKDIFEGLYDVLNDMREIIPRMQRIMDR